MNHCDLGFVGHVTALGISAGMTRAVRYAIREFYGDMHKITASNHSHLTEDDPSSRARTILVSNALITICSRLIDYSDQMLLDLLSILALTRPASIQVARTHDPSAGNDIRRIAICVVI